MKCALLIRAVVLWLQLGGGQAETTFEEHRSVVK